MTAAGTADSQSDAWTTPIGLIDPARPDRFQNQTMWPYFARLRRDAPVHRCTTSPLFGPFWSITRYNDIMAVELDHKVFSSDIRHGGISIVDERGALRLPMFIAMDPPQHDAQRKVVQPIVAPENLAKLSGLIRERAGRILDGLPRGQTFDWVERVSRALTLQMLATLFDMPASDCPKLARWSDAATAASGTPEWERIRLQLLGECLHYFVHLWNQRVKAPPRPDLVSMLAHGEATRLMSAHEYLGNVILLIVGGNDTTRNAISGGLLALDAHPQEYAKLRADPALISSMVPEIIRYQTPISHMRRTATQDVELHGQRIRAGDKVVLWYISGNRDPEAIEEPDRFIIDRQRPRQHLSFGFGIHRCVGNRLAELQLRILWEEILNRFPVIEVVGEPKRVLSSFVHGFVQLPVRIPAAAS